MNQVTAELASLAMIFVAGMVAYMATESFAWMIGAQVLTGAYGLLCYRHGVNMTRLRTIALLEHKLDELKEEAPSSEQ